MARGAQEARREVRRGERCPESARVPGANQVQVDIVFCVLERLVTNNAQLGPTAKTKGTRISCTFMGRGTS